MASSTADADHITPSSCSNSSRKVRIVARIRGFTDQEAESLNEDSAPWISVQKPSEDVSSEKVKICFGNASTSHKDVYAVDYCYEQKEDNDLIFSREIKPLISSVFDGQNVSIIAYGARGSGKTYTIQGTEEKQGLAALAIAEVLSMAEDIEKAVAVSFYELIQEHVYDILDPTRPEVQVLEDANGKIKLKGLSQVVVKSVSEFHKLYFNECTSRRATQKVPFQLPRRSHKGLIVHILCNNQRSNTKLLGKMNFVDLAGYEDSRRKSFESLNLVESSQVNKSLYALLNVVYAINANKTHVSYRESKLTRMLQDSFGGTNHVLILTCLNPLFCQDTINTTSLASRSCQGLDRVFKNSTKISKISAKPRVLHSLNKGKLGTVSAAVKKPTSSRAYLSGKNSNCLGKGRKLFDEGNQLSSSKQEKSPSNIASILQSRFLSDISSAIVPCLQVEETSLLNAPTDTKPEEEKDFLLCSESNPSEVTHTVDKNIKASTYLEDGVNTEKENKSLPISEDQSPPLSARLQELSNNLKSLYYSSPIQMKISCETFTSSSELVVSADIVEPKTPVTGQDARVKDNWEIANCHSETFSARSSGLKQSLVQEYLRFLNTASKEDLKGVRGIGEKRATYILELREESPEPFKDLDDLKDIGLSAKQIKGLMKNVAGGLF